MIFLGDSEVKTRTITFPKRFNEWGLTLRNSPIRGGWPLVIEYQLPTGAIGVVTIRVADKEPFHLFFSGGGSRSISYLTIPNDIFGSDLSEISISALVMHFPFPMGTIVNVYSLTAGDRAIGQSTRRAARGTEDGASIVTGAVSLADVHFQGIENACVQYTFRPLADFDGAQARFYRVTRSDAGVVEKVFEAEGVVFDFPRGDVTIQGLLLKKSLASGLYQFQVDAWKDLENGGEWAFAVSEGLIYVE